MTAEVAILNNSAVALAADSAVTTERGRKQKIYYNANKIFMLVKKRPIGIMIYGNASLMGIPWESIIKVFRQYVGGRGRDRLRDYGKMFISFLDGNKALISEETQRNELEKLLGSFLYYVKDELEKTAQKESISKKGISLNRVNALVEIILDRELSEWEENEYLDGHSKESERAFAKKYKGAIDNVIETVFEKLPLNTNAINKIHKFAYYLHARDNFFPKHSGIVVAGFGEKELFPSVVTYHVQDIFNNKLKYKLDESNSTTIDSDNNAAIIPFAQTDVVSIFLEGTDPNFEITTRAFLREVFKRFPAEILSLLENEQALTEIDKSKKSKIIKKLQRVGDKYWEELKNKMENNKLKRHIRPVLETVSVLPKEELAEMAESLVNLTSFKRRISLTEETVGPPIDVAVISKGDGFIWIKRKHYFRPELNMNFLARQLLYDYVGGQDHEGQ